MNKIFKIFNLAAVIVTLILSSCSKEEPFPGGNGSDGDKATGQVNFRKMVVEVSSTENEVRSAQVNVGEFLVKITSTPGVEEYAGTYAAMPEVITLPVGDYTVKVASPANPDAEWECPYYEGVQNFTIEENKVTFVEPVVCRLSNIRVSIKYDAKLLSYMEDDCVVTIQTGAGATLNFVKTETRSGYFRYVEDEGTATLIATFRGTVDENYEENVRTYTDVEPGNHYIITYSLKTPSGQEPDMTGTVSPGIHVDASLEVVNMNVNLDVDDDKLEDSDRPTQGDKPGTQDPNPPTPDKPTPEITASIGGTPAAFDTPIEVTDNISDVKIKVVSEADSGFTAFTIDIDSTTLTDAILSDVQLGAHLDLVNPGDKKTGLESLGFPTEIGGMKQVEFDISQFVPLLKIYGAGDHKFIVTVSDANGTTVRTLYFVTK